MFELKITLGNDAMKYRRHIGEALRKVGERIEWHHDTEGLIRDENGNKVGEWKLGRNGLEE